MSIQNDFTVDYANKKISHTSGSTRYTVNALYSWFMDLFDDAGQMDDTVPMKANTPTEYELINGWTFNSDTDLGYLYGGSIKVNQTDDLWANFYTLGSLESGAVIYIKQGTSLVSAYPGYSSGHIDQLVKVRASSVDNDSRYVTVFCRTWTDSYDHFKIQAPTTGGRNPVPLATSNDLNNQTASGTVGASPYTNITINFGSYNQDFDQDGATEPYDVTIDCAGLRVSQVYEYLKYVTRQASTLAINGVDGRFYTVANAAYAEVKGAPFGTFAGGKFFGARGVYLTNYDAQDANNIVLVDSDNNNKQAPTAISISVTNIVSGDRVLVARTSSGNIVKNQFTIASRTATTITVNEVIGNDIPNTGAIRVGDDAYTYTSLNKATKTFSGMSGVSAYSGGTAMYVPLIDEVATGSSISKSIVYVSDFPIVARVRNKGILPFENTGTVTTAGLAVSAIRTVDTIAV